MSKQSPLCGCGHRADYHNAFGTMPCAACDCARLLIPAPPTTPRIPKERPLKQDFALYLRDLAAVEREANQVLQQCAFLRRNGSGDEIRFWFIKKHAAQLLKASQRGSKRADQQSARRLA